jgi:hypothetical protein
VQIYMFVAEINAKLVALKQSREMICGQIFLQNNRHYISIMTPSLSCFNQWQNPAQTVLMCIDKYQGQFSIESVPYTNLGFLRE